MSKYSNIAHYQDFAELKKLLELSNNTYDMDKITQAYALPKKLTATNAEYRGFRIFFIPHRLPA